MLAVAKAWKWVLVASGLWSCALGFGYGDYERAPGTDAGSGGSVGTGGAFPTGGTEAGSEGASGSAGAAGSAGTDGGRGCSDDDGCPPDTECVDWFCQQTRCQSTVLPQGTSCGAPASCVAGEFKVGTCQGMECEIVTQNCVLASCSNTGCCVTCAQKVLHPELGYSFCTLDEQNRWNTLVTCCETPCKVVCVDSASDVAQVCAGASAEAPSSACLSCVASSCPSQLATCNTPTN